MAPSSAPNVEERLIFDRARQSEEGNTGDRRGATQALILPAYPGQTLPAILSGGAVGSS